MSKSTNFLPETMIRDKIKYYKVAVMTTTKEEATKFAETISPLNRKKIVRIDWINDIPYYGIYSPLKSELK